MQTDQHTQRQVLDEVIQKLMIVYGPDITFLKLRKIPSLSLTNSGSVADLKADGQEVLSSILSHFTMLSSKATRQIVREVLLKYPGVINMPPPEIGGNA